MALSTGTGRRVGHSKIASSDYQMVRGPWRRHDFLGGTPNSRARFAGWAKTGAARPALRPLEGIGLDNAAKTEGLADEELQRYGTVLTVDLGPQRWNYDGELLCVRARAGKP